MIPEFMRFYGYTRSEVLNEYGLSYFALSNTMLELKASESLEHIQENIAPELPQRELKTLIEKLIEKSEGISGILQEVRNIKS